MSAPRVACLVVAGGRSRRMGRDKNFVELAGEALLSRVCRHCVAVAPTWVVARAGQTLPELHGARQLADEGYPELGGPLVGIATGLRKLAAEGFAYALICGSDDVAVDERALRARLEALRSRPGVVGLHVRSEGRVQPLASAVHVQTALARAEAQLQARDARARVWAESLLGLDDAALGGVTDLDTPAELQSWVEGRNSDD